MNIIKKLLFFSYFLTAIIKKHYRTVVVGLVLGSLFFIFFPKLVKIMPQFRRREKIGIIGQYTINNLPEEILNQISLGLTSVSEKGEAIPQLAESWEITDQGKTYFFKLKDLPRVWHDGKPLKPVDINYNFKDVSFSLQGGFIKFSLKEPFSPFPIILSKPFFKKGFIGLGKYRVKRIEKSGLYIKSIYLVPYEQSSLFQSERDGNLPNKLYRFYNSEKDLKTAFNLGEINVVSEIFDLKGLFLGKSTKVSSQTMKDVYLGVFFNTANPLFQEKTFRQALAYAIPKETSEKRALGPLNPNSWAYNPDVKPYSQDFSRAKQLLDKDKQFLSQVKIRIATFPQYESVANQVREGWKAVGIDSEIQLMTFIPEDFDVFILANKIPPDPDQYYFWHVSQAGNISNFDNPRINKLLEDGRHTISKEERKNIYFDFQRFLIEESPAIFLSHPTSYTVTRD